MVVYFGEGDRDWMRAVIGQFQSRGDFHLLRLQRHLTEELLFSIPSVYSQKAADANLCPSARHYPLLAITRAQCYGQTKKEMYRRTTVIPAIKNSSNQILSVWCRISLFLKSVDVRVKKRRKATMKAVVNNLIHWEAIDLHDLVTRHYTSCADFLYTKNR